MRRHWLILTLLALPLSVPLAAAQAPPSADGAPRTGDVEAPAQPVQPVQPRDPFRPFTLSRRLESRAPLTPLQRYELGQLTVVATVWDVSPPRAMVEDSFGMGYIITLGTPIGNNGGVVAAIEPQRVVVEERVLDFYGREQINRLVMETPKEEGPTQLGRERK